MLRFRRRCGCVNFSLLHRTHHSLNASLSNASLLVKCFFAVEGIAPVLSNASLSKASLLVECFVVEVVFVASNASLSKASLLVERFAVEGVTDASILLFASNASLECVVVEGVAGCQTLRFRRRHTPVLSNAPLMSKESLLVERFDVKGVVVASNASLSKLLLSRRRRRCLVECFAVQGIALASILLNA